MRASRESARAFENMVAIALANYAGGEGNGHSMAFDGRAFEYDAGRDCAVSRDHLRVEAGAEAGIVFAEVDLDQLRAYRAAEVWGGAYRKVGAYGMPTTRPE